MADYGVASANVGGVDVAHAGAPATTAAAVSAGASAAKLSAVLRETKMVLFEYDGQNDILTILGSDLTPKSKVAGFLANLEQNLYVAEEDVWKAASFFSGRHEGAVELRVESPLFFANSVRCEDASNAPKCSDSAEGFGGTYRTVRVGAFQWTAGQAVEQSATPAKLEGYARDITEEKRREGELRRLAQRDSLTLLYNRATGRSLVDGYLAAKNPYASCGMIVVDVDFFKNANDLYGHQFGDEVLVQMARLLSMMFRRDDVAMRMGGDEFAVFLRNITCPSLVKKVQQLVEAVREITFPDRAYALTCSVGACFLPENVSGFTFDQLFRNADWALYRAKENGRNRYELCDNLQRFELAPESGVNQPDIDTRYLHGDIVSVAFEVFEKAANFNEATTLFLEIVGRRFSLDRITVVQTDIKKQATSRRFQWVSSDELAVLERFERFSKKDFLTLFNSYDEYGTAVLHYDDMAAYSDAGAALLMQGQAKTVLYAAMFSEGRYIGAVSYVTCGAKRFWSKQDRATVGELAKIIAAHLSRHQAINVLDEGLSALAAHDSLTGLLSFHRFREEVERAIVGGFAVSSVVAYIDFAGFGQINSEYGFGVGDKLLKDFGAKVSSAAYDDAGTLFSRVASDNFVLFAPCDDLEAFIGRFERLSARFTQEWEARYPKVKLEMRVGLYQIGPQCAGAAPAVDAASFARSQVTCGQPAVLLYDESMDTRRQRARDLVNRVDAALGNGQIVVYLQPVVRLASREIVAAEALVRWVQEDGSVLLPRDFVPLCERAGKVRDVDLYVLDRVAAFQVHCAQAYGRQLPISVNAALPFSSNETTPGKYAQVLESHGVDPALVQVEVSESDVVQAMGEGKNLLRRLQQQGLKTTLDGFGEDCTSLSDLIGAPLSSVKLARSYVGTCMAGEHGRKLLEGSIALLRGLGFEVVCEGVETEEQVSELSAIGCELAQGYFFSQPLPVAEFERLAFGEAAYCIGVDASEA